jgi:hydrogenase/urease accessory protein HupE
LEAQARGRYALHVESPVDSEGATSPVTVIFPAGCHEADGAVDCGGDTMRGVLTVDGLNTAAVRVVVQVVHHDGQTEEHILSASSPAVEIGHGATSGLFGWISMGVEHILLGFDHLAFVLALLLVVGLDRRLVGTLTAFTIGHSITLAANVVGLIPSSARAVEVVIAASVWLLAAEAARTERAPEGLADPALPTLTQRAPWLVAGAFGLIHGLGFASALRQLQLPPSSTVWALLGFNLGVEIGQLAFVGGCGLLWILAQRRLMHGSRAQAATRARALAIYALGGVTAWWTFSRLAALLEPLATAVTASS